VAPVVTGPILGRWPGLLLLLGLAPVLVGCGAPAPRPPNIVLILADDLGWRDTGVYGSEYYQTPHVDRLAAQGLRFTQAYSSSPLCSPTRASIVTGYHPAFLRFTMAEAHRDEAVELPAGMPATAAPDRAVVPAPSATRLALEHETVGGYLKAAGYRTGFFGKWHLGGGEWSPDRRGYDAVMPGGSMWGVERYYSPYHLPGFEDGPKGEHLDQRLAKEAVAFVRNALESRPDQPFFISFWPFSVHYPYQARTRLVEKYRRLKNPTLPQQNAIMAAMIEELDTALGILFEGLEQAGVSQDTVILFTSDNGGVDWMGQSPEAPMATDNHPLRGGKAQIYEGGIRVPLIVSWPGRVKAGRVSDQLVSSEDVFATILHIAGIDRDRQRIRHGESLYPLLVGRSETTGRNEVVIHDPNYVRRLDGSPASSIRVGRWKLIHNYATAGAGARPTAHELYDLERDIGETNDLVDREPAVVRAMRRRLDAALERMGALVPTANPAFRRASAPVDPGPQ
jgi:arylsulfatase A-like enzyme